jgi:hypothetical protein
VQLIFSPSIHVKRNIVLPMPIPMYNPFSLVLSMPVPMCNPFSHPQFTLKETSFFPRSIPMCNPFSHPQFTLKETSFFPRSIPMCNPFSHPQFTLKPTLPTQKIETCKWVVYCTQEKP